MFEETAALPQSGRVFISQTAATLHDLPSSSADVVVRLDQGDPVDIVPTEETKAGWLHVQTAARKQGYIKATTKLTTREQLIEDRQRLVHAGKRGRRQLLIGTVVLFVAIVLNVLLFAPLAAAGNVGIVFRGLIVVGAGQVFWGVEQIAYVRHTLKRFDALWKYAII